MRRTIACFAGGLIMIGSANLARAQMGGLGLYEVGGNGTGNANAGFAVDASDASISYFNPASMTLLEGHHFLAGVQAAYVDLTFSPGPLTTASGTDGGNAGGFVPGGGLYFVFSASDRVKLGFALNVPWGAQTLYDEDWVGRYHIFESTLLGVNFNPSVGVRITDWVSVGAGVQLYYFHLDQKIAANTLAGQITGQDGLVSIGGGDLAVGAVIGTTFEPTPDTTIGVVYRSPIQVDITGNAEFSNFGPIQNLIPGPKALNLGMTMPMALDVSVQQDLLDGQLALLFDAGWANARSFSQNFFTIGNVSGDIERNFRDTWRVAGGVHYWAAPAWMLQTGYSFDSSPVADDNRTPDLPAGELHRVALGTQVDVNEAVRLGAHYALGIAGNMGMDAPPIIPGSGRIQGVYNNTFLHFFLFTVAVHWGEPAPAPAPSDAEVQG
jgi:long-chain fatty acid transport protein